jgi:hypothetical protein
VRCVGGAISARLEDDVVRRDRVLPDAGDTRIADALRPLGDPIPNGATRWYQTCTAIRARSFCPPPQGSTFNISAGIAIVW